MAKLDGSMEMEAWNIPALNSMTTIRKTPIRWFKFLDTAAYSLSWQTEHMMART